jgi:hypothetical protein
LIYVQSGQWGYGGSKHGFCQDEINGVLVFRLSISTVGRQQMFFVSPTSLPLPLPFPDPAAGSVNTPTLRLQPCPKPVLSQAAVEKYTQPKDQLNSLSPICYCHLSDSINNIGSQLQT